MSERKWTKGPWKVESMDRCLGYFQVKGRDDLGDDEFVTDLEYDEAPDGRAAANASLIAAAPDLYAALEAAADAIMDCDEGDPTSETGWKSDELLDAWLAAMNALRKARGEPPIKAPENPNYEPRQDPYAWSGGFADNH